MKKVVSFISLLAVISLSACVIAPPPGSYGPVAEPDPGYSPVAYGEVYYGPPPFVPVGYQYNGWFYERSGDYVNIVFIDRYGHHHREYWNYGGTRMRYHMVGSWHKNHAFDPHSGYYHKKENPHFIKKDINNKPPEFHKNYTKQYPPTIKQTPPVAHKQFTPHSPPVVKQTPPPITKKVYKNPPPPVVEEGKPHKYKHFGH